MKIHLNTVPLIRNKKGNSPKNTGKSLKFVLFMTRRKTLMTLKAIYLKVNKASRPKILIIILSIIKKYGTLCFLLFMLKKCVNVGNY